MAASEALRKEVAQSLEDLPEDKVREVRDFVLFLRSRERTEDDEDPLLRVAGTASMDPVSSEEIDEVLYGEDPA